MRTSLTIAKWAGATDSAHMEKALEAVPRVRSVTLDPARHQAIVDHDGADEHQLTEAIKRVGYLATVE